MTNSGYTFTDKFCGAGGSSAGLRAAGLDLVMALNHWDRAIETHAHNFPDAEHLCIDVNTMDKRRLPSTHLLWASPICTEESPAGGRKKRKKPPTAGQLLLEEYGHVPQPGHERTRATFWDVLIATELRRYPIVVVENVVEVYQWVLIDLWMQGMQSLGYHMQIVCVSAAHIGDVTNPHAPQWRDRIYFLFTRTDLKPITLTARPDAWCFDCGEHVRAVQSWKRPDRPKVGKYGQQYVYRCPNTGCRYSVVEPFVLPAAAAIDWTDLGTRIGDRKKPLAAATMRRIRVGLEMFAQPVDVAVHGHTYERPGYTRAWPVEQAPLFARHGTPGDGLACPPIMVNANHDDDRPLPSTGSPFPTRSTKIGEGIAVAPFVVKYFTPRGQDSQMVKGADDEPLGAITTQDHHSLVTQPFLLDRYDYDGPDESRLSNPANQPMGAVTAAGRTVHTMIVPAGGTWNDTAAPAHEPMRTRTTRATDGIAVPPAIIDELRANSIPRVADEDALRTIAAGGNHAYFAVPGAFIQKHHGSLDYGPIGHMTKPVDDPMPSIVARPNLSLVIPYRRGRAKPASEPLLTVATRTSAGLAHSFTDADVDECLFRMLKPREHARAQRFADDYTILGNQGEQTAQAGNAVPSNVAQWIGRWAIATLDGAAT